MNPLPILFVYIWMHHVPPFYPCGNAVQFGTNTCFAITGHDGYSEYKVEIFNSEDQVTDWIKKNGHPGTLLNVKTGERKEIYTEPTYVIKKQEIEEKVVSGYEIRDTPKFPSLSRTLTR